MDPSRFVAPEFGEAIHTPGRYGYVAFRPKPVPGRSVSTLLLLGLDPHSSPKFSTTDGD